MSINLGLICATVNDSSRESLLNALAALGESDNDFCGENGPEYLWISTWDANGFKDYEAWVKAGEPALKYESNLAYLCEQVKDIADDEECIETYFKSWLYHDSYYDGYTWEKINDRDGQLYAIALSTVHSG